MTKWLPVIFFPGVLMLAAAAQFQQTGQTKADCRGIFAQHSGHDRRFLARPAKRIHTLLCMRPTGNFPGLPFVPCAMGWHPDVPRGSL
ncbi:MAG: hypothetical protein R2875_09335 [Desulfobacterales bacterium]